jgi:lipid-A-disaccharide synthase-like uncharacterized protein
LELGTAWLWVGLAGQSLFFSRFLVQWLASERHRESVIPVAFWYFSLVGGLILLAYAIHQQDPVFTVGQLTGLVVYTRNLWLIHRPKRRKPMVDSGFASRGSAEHGPSSATS